MHNMMYDKSSSSRAPRDRRHIRNPESLNSGMLVGKYPTPSTGIRTPLPIGTGWGHNTYEHS